MTPSSTSDGHDQRRLLRRTAREFAERECPLARLHAIEADGGTSAELWRALSDVQWTGILVPAEHGGAGATPADAAVLYEEMGRVLLPSPHLSSSVMAVLTLLHGGSAEQQRAYLPLLARGEEVWAPAIAEEDDDVWESGTVRLEAVQQAGGWALHGVKRFVPDAGMATRFLCAARPAGADGGMTLFLVGAADPGVTVRPMGGWTGQPLYEVVFDGAVAESVVGPAGGGWEVLQPALRAATVLLCAYMTGAAERVYERALDYAHQRVQFGQQIARFQRVQDHLIDMRNHIDAARCTTEEALARLERDDSDAERYVSLAKAVTSEGFYRVCEAAHHVHAGIGSAKDFGLYLYTKASHSFYHTFGSPALHERRVGRLLAAEPA